ncbi:MAG: response regulator [Bacteroidales bacterium]|jgi:DNA-binding NarL/FixJ family response regulator
MHNIIKVVIVDDHQIFLAGLQMILDSIPDVKVVASAQNGNQVLSILKKQKADIIFMDIKMPDINGVQLTRIIKERFPDTLIIGLSMFSEIEYFNSMMDAGADGYILKNTQEEELEKAIKEVMAGGTYISKEFINVQNRMKSNKQHKPRFCISKREKAVLELICLGLTNNEIAKKLNISTYTVDGHRRNLIIKTGVKNTPSLVMFAVQNELITL